MDFDIESNTTKNIKIAMGGKSLSISLTALIMNIPEPTLKDKLSNKSPWKILELAKFCLFIKKSIDEIVFGDKNFITNTSDKQIYNVKSDIKNSLVKDKKYKLYGKLTADGFFDELKS